MGCLPYMALHVLGQKAKDMSFVCFFVEIATFSAWLVAGWIWFQDLVSQCVGACACIFCKDDVWARNAKGYQGDLWRPHDWIRFSHLLCSRRSNWDPRQANLQRIQAECICVWPYHVVPLTVTRVWVFVFCRTDSEEPVRVIFVGMAKFLLLDQLAD